MTKKPPHTDVNSICWQLPYATAYYIFRQSHRARDNHDEGNLLKTVQEASSRALANVPSHGTYYAEIDNEIITALTTAAQNQAIVAHPLTAHSNANANAAITA